MKVVVFYDIGDICLEDVVELCLQEFIDVIVWLIVLVICGIDLYFVCGSVGGMCLGIIFGYEGVGIVEVFGDEVCNLQVGDWVVIFLIIVCGNCVYC